MGSNGKTTGDAAGDQGKEVCIRNWYNKQWDVLLRCRDAVKAEAMAKACEAGCNNQCIGYDQNTRNTLNYQARLVGYDLARIKTACNTDCSAFMTVCAQAAGISVPYNGTNAPTTRTMEKAFMSTGMFEAIKDKAITQSDKYLKRGDILVKAGSHTVMVLDTANTENRPTLRQGSTGPYVRIAQGRLVVQGFKIDIDGDFGPQTKQAVISLQGMHGLRKDGIIGPATWAIL